ncbi:glycoside hydrolase family 3 C-terminal domain-containing protein [Gryllotalpicola protaetiae]|uniref:Exo-alpha-(1->6)-L-arabinopyranosidase n=1 Tax=Gryllotalpicola protaetiae TaxID=2419771 RepID=A0A387BMH4_9MICO|nr:glycoside hydrolase family 3 C-terminal domain-containing protein [Gryllotalpicola protaetiae]AYG02220.1 beta-glucosidase [Gryllotalpicola protaetiae]
MPREDDEVIPDLTIEQKATLASGADFWSTKPVPGIRRITMNDGPHGMRVVGDIGIKSDKKATCFPPAVGLGATWNPALQREVGAAIGREARALGVDIVLGPGINIKRSPLCGRNFEYVSEDPLVAGSFGQALVEGIQSQGVGASVKHFAANNQETDRMQVSAEVDERTLREIYLPAFEQVVKNAAPATVMCSYNRVNGVYASQNEWLLSKVLRDDWGFDGVVVSDWGAVVDRVEAVKAGLDLKMPTATGDDRMIAAAESGELPEFVLDRVVARLQKLADRADASRLGPVTIDFDAQHELALRAALEGPVLLKNENGALPLPETGSTRIAVVGEFARTPRFQGSGSSQVPAAKVDSALGELSELLGDRVRFAPGFTFDGSAEADEALAREARSLAAESDWTVLFLGLPDSYESEGFDRASIDLPANQLALLETVSAVTRRVVVVLSNGGLVETESWEFRARAILEGWLLGQAGGAALAQLLVGRANPSGKLTESIPVKLEETPAYINFPGCDGQVVYGERIYVGYRYYDTRGLPVSYPFGHGLSYTEFEYSGLSVSATDSGASVVFTVTNVGEVAGAEVAQVYRGDRHSKIDRPVHELVGFRKVFLEPGESETVTIELDSRAFAYWSIARHGWIVDEGLFTLSVGASSRDLRLSGDVRLAAQGPALKLTQFSSIADWFADPIGAQVLQGAIAQLPDAHAFQLDVTTNEGKMFAAIPLGHLLTMVPQAPTGAAQQLVAAYEQALAGR